ncbi:MAG: hypothetical protein ACRDK9_06565 [Solirubrobacterales bacterium]
MIALLGTPVHASAASSPGLSIGVVPQAELGQEDFRTMGAGGIDSARLIVSWAKVERSPGSYQWSEIDRLVALASRAGITPLALLYGTPRWVVEDGVRRCEPAACATLGPVSASATERFARFAGAAAARYGPRGAFWLFRPDLPKLPIRAWEIWNEPNSPAFFGPQVDPGAYGALLSGAAARIHAVDAGAEVLVGGLATQRFSSRGTTAPLRYLRELVRDPNAVGAFDGVAIHPYAGGAAGVLRRVRAVRELLDDAGLSGRGLWVTESGWASSGNRRHPLVARERGQARLLRRVFRRFAHRAQRWNLRAAYWYSWRDTPREQAVCRWCAGTGLLRADWRPKRAWRQLSALARPKAPQVE